MRNCNVKQLSPAAGVRQLGFYKAIQSLSLSIYVNGSWKTECARSYAQRMRALSTLTHTHNAWSYGSLPLPPPPPPSPPQNNAPSQRRTKLGREAQRQPRGTFLSVSSSVFAERWLTQSGKKKKPPSPISFRSSQMIWYDFPRNRRSRRASALVQWQARHPLVSASALIAVVPHVLQRLTFEWLALRILQEKKKSLITRPRLKMHIRYDQGSCNDCTRD